MEDLTRELRREVKNMDISGIEILEKSDNKNAGKVQPEPMQSVEESVGDGGSKTEAPMGECSYAAAETVDTRNTTVIFMLGMAGSGKTTFTQRLAAHFLAQGKVPYILNFDPACEDPPFPVNIDIRDTVNYKKVMQQYNLGPNGGIVTSLNLFTTIFEQVLNIVKQRAKTHEYILVDTPGQLECFLWSASGQIILHSFAAYFPTIITYVTDLTICKNPISFASNMMYGVTILYKSKLPMIIALNKVDIEPPLGKLVSSWIVDFELLQEALRKEEGYSCNLASSINLALDEFYNVVDHVVVSAYDGYGLKDYEKLLHKGVEEYNKDYVKMYREMREDYENNVAQRRETNLTRFRKDFHTGARNEVFSMQATSTLSEGIDLLPHDSDADETSDESQEEDNMEREEEDRETMKDFVSSESAKRDHKRQAPIILGNRGPNPQI